VRERLAERVARTLVVALAPEHVREMVATQRPFGEREVGEQRDLAGLRAQRRLIAPVGTEQREPAERHEPIWGRTLAGHRGSRWRDDWRAARREATPGAAARQPTH